MEDQTDTQKALITEYISQLSDVEKKVFDIAQDHLKSSFSITKSIGYIQWYSKHKSSK